MRVCYNCAMKQLGNYELLHHITTGGMAEVYLARQTGLAGFSKLLILKMIRPELSEDPEFAEMFLNEARLTAALDHPGIGQVFDVGKSDGRYYLVMEFIRGETLRKISRACRERGNSFPLDTVLFIFRRVCEALHFIHGHSPPVVHRDISPQNIMISFDGAVKLIDFGIAKACDLSESESTQVGIIKGKFSYLSPEQARGERLTPQTDIFSLGVVLWEILTGKRLFRRPERLLTLQAVMEAPIPDPRSLRPDVPPELSRCVLRALARSPSERYSNAMEMLLDLENISSGRNLQSSQVALARFARELLPEKVASLQRLLSAEKPARNLEKQLFDDLHFDLDGDADSLPPEEGKEPVRALAGEKTESIPAKPKVAGPTTLLNLALILEGPDPAEAADRLHRRTRHWKTLGWLLLGLVAVALLAGAAYWHWTTSNATPERHLDSSLKIVTVPAGAQVWLDGKLQPGKTPMTIPKLQSGREFLLHVRLPHRPDWSGNVKLHSGESREMKIKL